MMRVPVPPIASAEKMALEAGIREKLATAIGHGEYMVAVWHIDRDQRDEKGRPTLCFNRWMNSFPKGDFNRSLQLLQEDLTAEVEKIEKAAV